MKSIVHTFPSNSKFVPTPNSLSELATINEDQPLLHQNFIINPGTDTNTRNTKCLILKMTKNLTTHITSMVTKLGTLYNASTKYLASSTWYKYLVPRSCYKVLRTKYVPRTWCKILGEKYAVQHTCHEFGTTWLAQNTLYATPCTK